MTFIYLIATWSLYVFLSVISICTIIVVRFNLTNGAAKLDKCGLYMGKVSHTRLKGDIISAFTQYIALSPEVPLVFIVTRLSFDPLVWSIPYLNLFLWLFFTGGATHHFVYPLFFSFIDLQQISEVGWSLWPIFKLNGGSYSFCSLDEKDHLKDWTKEQQNVRENIPSARKAENLTLLQKVIDFVGDRTKMAKKLPPKCSISLLTHLTYFGYCFNPISVFYCLRPDSICGINTSADGCKSVGIENKNNDYIGGKIADENVPPFESTDSPHVSKIESIIVEVSNTPWIEQHSYMLDESVEHVSPPVVRYFSCPLFFNLSSLSQVALSLLILCLLDRLLDYISPSVCRADNWHLIFVNKSIALFHPILYHSSVFSLICFPIHIIFCIFLTKGERDTECWKEKWQGRFPSDLAEGISRFSFHGNGLQVSTDSFSIFSH